MFQIFFFTFHAVCGQNTKEGLVACYSFDNNANDGVGDNHGIVHGAILTEDRNGKVNSAYIFDGINDYIEVKGEKFRNNQYSISFWALPIRNPPSNEYHYAISIGGTGGDQSIDISNGAFNAVGWTFGTYLISQSSIPPVFCAEGHLPEVNKWAHIVVLRSVQQLKLYIDKKLICETSTMGLLPNFGNNTKLTIGRRAQGGQFLNAKIDDIALYNRVLTEQEIEVLYKQLPCEEVHTIHLKPIPSEICLKDSIKVSFMINGTFNTGNEFRLQIAEENSSNFVTIASTPNSGMITAPFPASIDKNKRYQVRVVSTSPNIVSDSTRIFRIKSVTNVSLSGDAEIELGEKTLLRIDLEGEHPSSIKLSEGTLIENISQTPVFVEVQPSANTTYSLGGVVGGSSCGVSLEGKATVTIKNPSTNPEEVIFVPDVFTPNEDGLNDFFIVKGHFLSCQMTIFNRWGTAIFQTNDCQNGWNGKFKNEDMPIGNYVYKIEIEVTTGKLRRMGVFSLMR